MSALSNLIRVHRWTLDERRRTLVDLERLGDKLKGDLANLEAELERERHAAARSPETAYAYPAFAAAARQRREKLLRSLAELAGEVDKARSQVEAAFQELKKYELAQEAAQRRKQEMVKRREQAVLDEVGITLHLRQRAGEEH